jgi:hypothetical protein
MVLQTDRDCRCVAKPAINLGLARALAIRGCHIDQVFLLRPLYIAVISPCRDHAKPRRTLKGLS